MPTELVRETRPLLPGRRSRRPWSSFPTQIAIGVGLGTLLGIATPTFVRLIRSWGRNIPQPAIEADYLFGLVWAVLLGVTILVWPVKRSDKRPLLVLWAVKCVVALGFMLLYEWNYYVDAFNYFQGSVGRSFPFDTMAFGAGTQNIEGLAWLHSYVLPNSYHAMKLSFAMLGLIAVYLVYRGAVRVLGREDYRLLFFLGLFPSILFWSTTLGKDPVQLLGIGIYIYGVACWRTGRVGPGIGWILAGILVASAIRLWSAPILTLPLVVYAVLGTRGFLRRTVVLLGCLVGLWLGVSAFADRLGLETAEDIYMQADIMASSGGFEGGSGQEYDVQFTSIGSMIAFVPMGAFTALFRPLPGEVMNPFGLLAGLENVFLLGLVVLAVFRSSWSDFREPLVLWALVLVVSWAGVYGFISVYNLGAAVRFKLQILPLLLCLLLFMSRARISELPTHAR